MQNITYWSVSTLSKGEEVHDENESKEEKWLINYSPDTPPMILLLAIFKYSHSKPA